MANPFSLTQPTNGLFGSPVKTAMQTSTPSYMTNGGLLGSGFHTGLITGMGPTYSAPQYPGTNTLSVGTKAVSPASNVTPPVNTIKPNQTAPATPAAQASYQGGQALPAVGSAAYVQAQNLAHPTSATPTLTTGGSTSNTSSASTGIPSTFSSIVNNQANTQPYTAVGNAVGTSQGIASGVPGTVGVDQTNQNNAYSAQGLLGNFAQNQTPAVNQAYQNLQNFNKTSPLISATQASIPMGAGISTGRGQILGNQLSNTEQGLSNTYNSAVQGEQQQISSAQNQGNLANTGISNQLQGANQAGNLANSAQSNQIGAQQNAASNVLNSLAQQGYVIINKTTGQPLSTQGAMSAAFTGGQTGGAETAGGNTFAMNQANTAAKGIQGTIQQFLASNPNINSNTSTLANAAQQWLSGQQLGDPKYQTLFNYLNEYTNTLAPILGVGGDPTNLKTQIAQGFINAQASGQSISQVLNTISSLADQKLANLTSAGQGGGQVAGGTPQGSNPTSFGSEW